MAEQVFANKPVVGTVPESLRIYLQCSMMEWAHLPLPGGLYDQHPDLLDQFWVIAQIESKARKRQHEEAERKARSKSRR